jgi:ubiquinone/menaquinone biosynthesis C-methylase UbiE
MEIRSYTVQELQTIADEVGERSGWDFSRMETTRDPVPWDFKAVVENFLRPTDVVLDVGTGGGERLLGMADHFASAVGIDPDPDMIRVARRNTAGVSNVRFLRASAEHLAPLDDAAFDVVLTRHAPVSVMELNRVTKAGGIFICQGVGARNMNNIRKAFDTGSEELYLNAYASLLHDLSAAGWHLVAEAQYDVRYWVKDVPSLVFWFKAIAGANEVPADFDVATHHDVVNTLIREYGSHRGLTTNEHRTLVIARKPERSGMVQVDG